MELKSGSVEDLFVDDTFMRNPALAETLLHHVLQALDYLACKGIVHRDVKPQNILYTTSPAGAFKYQLADFGLANIVGDAQTRVGSGIYMAPELDNEPRAAQSSKMDVWSLFVTLTYAMDVAGFRAKPLHPIALRIKAVQEAANEEIFRPIRGMAVVDPSQRSSAADILDKVWAGEGRTIPRNQQRIPIYNGATGADSARLGPSEESIKPDDVAGARKRSREPDHPETHPKEEGAFVSVRRQKRAIGDGAENCLKQVHGPMVQPAALDHHKKETEQEPDSEVSVVLKIPGAFPVDTNIQ